LPGEEEATEGGGNVTALTADTLADYTIYDVVVPLPGFNIKLPNNEVYAIFLERKDS